MIAIQAAQQDPDPFLRRAFAAVWEEERDLADPVVLAELAEEAGLDSAHLLDLAQGSTTEAIYALNLENAVAADVFGSPAYVLDGEVFWGQDRLDLLDDALASGAARLPAGGVAACRTGGLFRRDAARAPLREERPAAPPASRAC